MFLVGLSVYVFVCKLFSLSVWIHLTLPALSFAYCQAFWTHFLFWFFVVSQCYWCIYMYSVCYLYFPMKLIQPLGCIDGDTLIGIWIDTLISIWIVTARCSNLENTLLFLFSNSFSCDMSTPGFINSYDDHQPPPPQAHQNEALYSRPFARQQSSGDTRLPGNDPNSSPSYNQPANQNLPPPPPHGDTRVSW